MQCVHYRINFWFAHLQMETASDLCITFIEWIQKNKEKNFSSVLIAYSLGKAQRLLTAIAPLQETVFLHGAIWNMHQALVSCRYGITAG